MLPLLQEPESSKRWLSDQRINDLSRGFANLQSLQEVSGPDWFAKLATQLEHHLGNMSDPDRALNNLERLAKVVRPNGGREFWQILDEATGGTDTVSPQRVQFRHLLTILADSQYLSDYLIRDEHVLQRLEQAHRQPMSRNALVQNLGDALKGVDRVVDATKIIRDFKQQETARIAIGDLVFRHRLVAVVEQISLLAESICESTWRWVYESMIEQWGTPRSPTGDPAQFVVLAMGKLGGTELNYSSDIDLVMVYSSDGHTNLKQGGSVQAASMSRESTRHRTRTNREFFERLTREFVKIISEPTTQTPAYRVDLRLRPEGSRGKICSSFKSLIHYYDFQGRTWERQALIKARPVAGDLALGEQVLHALQPWIYRSNLNRADIAGIKALKRRIERRTLEKGESQRNIKTGHGGIRDIEFVIQFLQLLNGGIIPAVRTPNTLQAVARLESSGCLTSAESTLLTQNYSWLRMLEHRLQLMHDLQTHTLPTDQAQLQQIAIRMGYSPFSALSDFHSELAEITDSNRTILNHLLLGAFGNTFGSLRDSVGQYAFPSDEPVPPEVDLILEPDPDTRLITTVLRPYGFENLDLAFKNLKELATENTAFLSTRRCHHFLAAIAPALLERISETPDPDGTLTSLATVSESLGAKGVLWELFHFAPSTLDLYVRLCATSNYLADILKSNPGMIDELIDALQVNQLPSFEFLRNELDELTRGATDIVPIIFSFKNAQHLRVGIRDIIGRDIVQRIHRTLADVAEVCLHTITQHQIRKKLKQFEVKIPQIADQPADFQVERDCPFVILALGKLGGRDPNYHSDLDVVFLYDHDPKFESKLPTGTSSQYFFSELAASVTGFISHSQKFGRLYEMDCRLRPTGKSGPLAVSLDEFTRYFDSGQGWVWERQALCKARVVFGNPDLIKETEQRVRSAIANTPWSPDMAQDIAQARLAMEEDCREQNLKRGPGGSVDVEFAIQALQLKHASEIPSVLVPGTHEAITALVEQGCLDVETGSQFEQNYQFLRSVEARLRQINTTARHDLPTDEVLLGKLAFLLDADSVPSLRRQIATARQEIREGYQRVFGLLAEC